MPERYHLLAYAAEMVEMRVHHFSDCVPYASSCCHSVSVDRVETLVSGDGNDTNPALPDTSMKLGKYVYKHELFKIFSLANQHYSNFQDGGSKFQDGCQNKY